MIKPSDPLFPLLDHLFLLAFTSEDIIFHTFIELHSTFSENKIFVINFLFKPPPPPPPLAHSLNSQNPLSMTKVFS